MNLTEFAQLLNLDQPTEIKAAQLLNQLVDEPDLKLAVPAVVYLCCFHCQVPRLDGTFQQGNGVTLTQVIANLDDHTNIEDFLKFLLELPKRVDEPSAEFEDTVLRANVSFRLYKKFERCFELVSKKQNPEATPEFESADSYLIELHRVAWLFYLLSRSRIFQFEEQHPYMISHPDLKAKLVMVCTLSEVLRHIPENYDTPTIERMLNVAFQETNSEVLELQDDIIHYSTLATRFVANIVNDVTHSKEPQYEKVFQESHLKHSYKVLQNLYEQAGKGVLDESCFLRKKVVFTPKKQNLHQFDTVSKKVKTQDPPFMQTPLRSNKFSQNQGSSNTEKLYFEIGKQNSLTQTPFTKVSEEHSWKKKIMKEEIKFLHNCFQKIDRSYEEKVKAKCLECINVYMSTSSSGYRVNIQDDIIQLNWVVLDGLIGSQSEFDLSLLENEKYLNSILALSIYTQYHLDNKFININVLFESCNVTPIDVWRVISNFARFHIKLPQKLSQDLFQLDKLILLNLIWHGDTNYLCDLLRKYYQKNQKNEQTQLRYFEDQLVKRFLKQLGLRVKEIAQIINLKHLEQLVNSQLVQFLQNPKPDIVQDINMDSLIMCSFFMYQKLRKEPSPAFGEYKKHYQRVYPEYKCVFNRIVEFYNQKFLNVFRHLTKELPSDQLQDIVVPTCFIEQSPVVSRIYDKPVYTSAGQSDSQLRHDLASQIMKNHQPQ